MKLRIALIFIVLAGLLFAEAAMAQVPSGVTLWQLVGSNITQLRTTWHLKLSDITGSTQCLHANSTGVVSGTGSDCGSGGGGGSSATTTINSATGPTFTFATSTDTNIKVTITTSSGPSIITFAPGFTGTLPRPASTATSCRQ